MDLQEESQGQGQYGPSTGYDCSDSDMVCEWNDEYYCDDYDSAMGVCNDPEYVDYLLNCDSGHPSCECQDNACVENPDWITNPSSIDACERAIEHVIFRYGSWYDGYDENYLPLYNTVQMLNNELSNGVFSPPQNLFWRKFRFVRDIPQ